MASNWHWQCSKCGVLEGICGCKDHDGRAQVIYWRLIEDLSPCPVCTCQLDAKAPSSTRRWWNNTWSWYHAACWQTIAEFEPCAHCGGDVAGTGGYVWNKDSKYHADCWLTKKEIMTKEARMVEQEEPKPRKLQASWALEETVDFLQSVKGCPYGVNVLVDRERMLIAPMDAIGKVQLDMHSADVVVDLHRGLVLKNRHGPTTPADRRIAPDAPACSNGGPTKPAVSLQEELAQIDAKHEPRIQDAKDRLARLRNKPSVRATSLLRDILLVGSGSIIGGGAMMAIYHSLHILFP